MEPGTARSIRRAGCGVFAIAGLFFLVGLGVPLGLVHEIISNAPPSDWASAPGLIVSSTGVDTVDAPRAEIVYEYAVAGQRYRGRARVQAHYLWRWRWRSWRSSLPTGVLVPDKFREGQPVEVRYDPAQPSISEPAMWARVDISLGQVFGVGLALLIGSLCLMLGMKLWRRRGPSAS